MTKKEIMIIANYSQDSLITLEELCQICNLTNDEIQTFISYEIIHPRRSNQNQQQILFELVDLHRIKTALRLQHDLEVNLAGAALALDLLEQLEDLRRRMKSLEKHF